MNVNQCMYRKTAIIPINSVVGRPLVLHQRNCNINILNKQRKMNNKNYINLNEASTSIFINHLNQRKFRKNQINTITHSGAMIGSLSLTIQSLVGLGIFVLCTSLSVFLIAAISTLKEMRNAARRVDIVMKILELEMPDTMAAMRLSSLEISDCVEEFTGLGSDLANGLRTSARALVSTERGVRGAVNALSNNIIPNVNRVIPETKDVIETILRERASLIHDNTIKADLANDMKQRFQSIRNVVKAIAIGKGLFSLWQFTKNKLPLHNFHRVEKTGDDIFDVNKVENL